MKKAIMIKFYSIWTPCLITGGVEVVSRRDQEIKYVNGLMEGRSWLGICCWERGISSLYPAAIH